MINIFGKKTIFTPKLWNGENLYMPLNQYINNNDLTSKTFFCKKFTIIYYFFFIFEKKKNYFLTPK